MKLDRQDHSLVSNPLCLKVAEGLTSQDFQYFDKDGFELNQAERKFYSAMNYPIHYPILNHCCWQEPWFVLEDNSLILDHSIILHRCSYAESALDQLHILSKTIPLAKLLIQARQKWGYDFDLNAVAPTGDVFEVLHIEYDNTDYDSFKEKLIYTEYMIRHTDWKDAAQRIWNSRDQWQHLKGFDQNHWKANYLIGWSKSESLEKVI
jgi:hypothetical protein